MSSGVWLGYACGYLGGTVAGKDLRRNNSQFCYLARYALLGGVSPYERSSLLDLFQSLFSLKMEKVPIALAMRCSPFFNSDSRVAILLLL